MLRSLWFKSLLLLMIVGAVALSAAIVLRQLMLVDFREYLEGETEDRVYGILASLEASYERQSGWREESQSREVIWALTEGFEVRLVDENGKLVTDTSRAIQGVSPLFERRLKAFSQFRTEPGAGEFVPYPMFLGGRPVGTLEVRELRGVKEKVFVQRSASLLLVSILFVGAAAVVLSFLFSQRLTRPIKELARAASAISRGDLRSHVAVARKDEVGNLAVAFNRMVKSLQTQESLRKKLIADVAHELRTPLGVMRGELEAVMDGMLPHGPERVQSLYEETGRLKKIVDGIEELNEAEAGVLSLNRQQFNLKPFLQNIVDRFRASFLEKAVALEVRCGEGVTVFADPERLSQIVVNLVSNALKATGTGGHVSIEVEPAEGEVAITIADNGSGIKEEDHPYLFERFYRGPGGGLGIGLTIVKELLEAQGGRIEVKSVYGAGSSFTAFLPGTPLHNSS
jgi:two-component system sensor histidine kinase BaeS